MNQWKDHWPAFLLSALLILVVTITVLGYWQRWTWTGLVGFQDSTDSRSAWDWLELLIIPVALGLAALWFNRQSRKSEQDLAQDERNNDREIAQDRTREETLQRYLDRMQELILNKGLLTSEQDSEVRQVTRARTLSVLRSLDGVRKGMVLQFLHDSNLIGRSEVSPEALKEVMNDIKPTDLTENPLPRLGDLLEVYDSRFTGIPIIEAVIGLRNADLSGVFFDQSDLEGVDLGDTDLTYAYGDAPNLNLANLSKANLSGASFYGAQLFGANLAVANLVGADLEDAFLAKANLTGTDLSEVHLGNADLRGAMLSGAVLTGADLRGANLLGAMELSRYALAKAGFMPHTTLPDGTVIETEEQEAAFKQEHSQGSE